MKSLIAYTKLCLIVALLSACGLASTTKSPTTTPDDMPTATAAATEPSAERIEIGEDLQVRQIQKGIFVITHAFPWPANSLLVEMENGALVLVDTPYTPEATREMLTWIEAQFGQRDITAINTGFHYDNLGGNAAMIEKGIPVYGSDLTPKLLAERGEALRAMTLEWLKAPQDQHYYRAHQALEYVAPTRLFPLEEGLNLDFGDETVQVYFPGVTHTPDNVVVYFPTRKVLFGGCMIIGGDQIGNTADADMAAWPKSLRKLDQFDIQWLIPGHGNRVDPALLEHSIALLTENR